MKKLCLALSLLLTFGCGPSAPSAAVSPAEAKQIIASTPNLYVIDVRKPEAFAERRYPNAVNMPVSELGSRIYEIPNGRPILMHCRSGRSVKTAYAILKKLRPDLKDVRYIDGEPLF